MSTSRLVSNWDIVMVVLLFAFIGTMCCVIDRAIERECAQQHKVVKVINVRPLQYKCVEKKP